MRIKALHLQISTQRKFRRFDDPQEKSTSLLTYYRYSIPCFCDLDWIDLHTPVSLPSLQ
ncbi:hypothetical protein PAHAL_2G035100 [Panicum hallii]|uniref:Uncharacterized protein n=1 Tax=Panicum hallii TaxID=206008 RepID=A0A2T8KMR6_9POAL|nr:hypothetical protein PAHAL_2G035100 [Panicum hallii]